MPERWRSPAARELARAVRKAGGRCERVGTGRLLISGPSGSVTIQEPAGPTRRDQRRRAAERLIAERTGLNLS